MQNSRFRNAKSKVSFFVRIIFTKLMQFWHLSWVAKKKIVLEMKFY
ncbi:Uncharacterised protein [Prevotella intermedia]|nr:Uncharacterised protein [Prevotella intermedia]